MVAATSIDYSETFYCQTCASFEKKDGPTCQGCPAFEDTHYFPRGEGVEACDVVFVGDVPEVPALALLKRNEGNSAFFHEAFSDDGGKVVKAAVAQLQADELPEKPGTPGKPSKYRMVTCRYIYAVKCAVEKPNKDTIEHCNTPLTHELGKIAAARKNMGKLNPLVAVATGSVALKALGINIKNFEEDAAGRVFPIDIGSVRVIVVAAMSLKAMAAQAGKASNIVADIQRAFDVVLGKEVKVLSRAEVEKNYEYPYTNQEVETLVDKILAYTEGNIDAIDWAISFDTETNTLHPHRDTTKWLTATFSWASGYACSIALFHPKLHEPEEREVEVIVDGFPKLVKQTIESPYAKEYDPHLALQQVMRLLSSRKPKIGHNIAKYDQKVVWKYKLDIVNIRWDTMLAEHGLEEDKKGQYGLKALVKQHIPELCGYEDKLHEFLDEEEGEDQGASIKEQQAEKEGERPLPKPISDALERCGLTPKFQAGNLEKQVERIRSRIANKSTIDETITYFSQYGISPPFHGKDFKKKWKKIQDLAAKVKANGLGLPNIEVLLPDSSRAFKETEIEIIEHLSTLPLEDFDPVTDADHQFLVDAELLLIAKRSGEFVKKVEKKTKKEKDGGFENIPLSELNFYGAVDADATRRIAVIQRLRINDEDTAIARRRKNAAFDLKYARGLDRKYQIKILCNKPTPLVDMHRNKYLPRAKVLADMEYRGVKINQQYLRDSKIELDNVVMRTGKQIFDMAGQSFNINSGPQLGKFLFDTGMGFIHPNKDSAWKLANNPELMEKLKYDGTRMSYRHVSVTKHKTPQVNEKTFRTYITNYDCPFSDLILLYKKAIKARDTFLSNIELLSSIDGRIHANFNLHGTSTGRLSCISAATNIDTNYGTFKVTELAYLTKFKTFHIFTHKGRLKPILAVFPKGIDSMYRVTLASGKSIVCTMDHRFMTPSGWKYLKELNVNAEITQISERPDTRRSFYKSSIRGTASLSSIASIEYCGEEEVWDLTVKDDESYVAHGFVNHNSSNINLQNIPVSVLGAIVDHAGKLILDASGVPIGPGVKCKKLFIPDDDSYCIINADAKGAEVGLFSGYTRDAQLIKALLEGRDSHCYFAAMSLDPAKIAAGLTGEAKRIALVSAGIDDEHAWSYDDFYAGKDGKPVNGDAEYGKRLKKLRTNIKRVVFGILFGAGPVKIADIAGISEDLARTIIKALFTEFPSIPAFIDQTKWELRTFGFVETFHGRRRRFHWNPRTAPKKMLAKAERQAVNFKIQGTNSDMVMDVLVAVNEVLERDLRGRMLLTVHDSLVFQVPKKYVGQVKDMMYELGTKQIGITCPWLPVPYIWDVEAGPSYGDTDPIDEYIKNMPPENAAMELQGFLDEEAIQELREAVWEREEGEVLS